MAILSLLLCALSAPIVLDNGAVRVEVEPRVFSVRFVGVPGRRNFLDPLPLTDEALAGSAWLDPGGLHTDVIPYPGPDAALRRGPAEVIEQSGSSVVMLGPVSEALKVRLSKEVRLVGREPLVLFTVSLVAASGEPARYAIRNTARVPLKTTLRVRRADGSISALAGAASIFPCVVKSNRYWLIPVPPTARTKQAILGAFVPEVTHQNDSGLWVRRIVPPPSSPDDVPDGSTFMCVLDDATRSYGAALQGPTTDVTPGSRLTFTEEWTLRRRGR